MIKKTIVFLADHWQDHKVITSAEDLKDHYEQLIDVLDLDVYEEGQDPLEIIRDNAEHIFHYSKSGAYDILDFEEIALDLVNNKDKFGNGTIHRVYDKDTYKLINRNFTLDTRLSLEAKGVYAIMLLAFDEDVVSTKNIKRLINKNPRLVEKYLEELREYDYLERDSDE